MHDDINDVIIFSIEPVEKICHQRSFAHRSINVGQEIRDGFEFLAICVDREIPNILVTELVVELYGPCFFVVAEEILQTDPDLARCASGFECAIEELL